MIGELDDDIESTIKEGLKAEIITAEPSPNVEPPSTMPEPSARMSQSSSPAEDASPNTGRKVSPRAKSLAQKSGIDLSQVKGSGPSGRILERDVREAMEDVGASRVESIEKPLSQMRKAIARITTESK